MPSRRTGTRVRRTAGAPSPMTDRRTEEARPERRSRSRMRDASRVINNIATLAETMSRSTATAAARESTTRPSSSTRTSRSGRGAGRRPRMICGWSWRSDGATASNAAFTSARRPLTWQRAPRAGNPSDVPRTGMVRGFAGGCRSRSRRAKKQARTEQGGGGSGARGGNRAGSWRRPTGSPSAGRRKQRANRLNWPGKRLTRG